MPKKLIPARASSSLGRRKAFRTDKNPRSYGRLANKENGSGTVIADKTVVLACADGIGMIIMQLLEI